MSKQTNTLTLKYHASLAGLFGLVIFGMAFPELVFALAYVPLVILGLFIALVVVARRLARQVSRETSSDSVLIFRYWLLGFWVVVLVIGIINQIMHFAAEYANVNYVTHTVVLAIIAINIFGIYIHNKKKSAIIKNVKKDDLFQ